MATDPDMERYERFSWEYEMSNPLSDDEIAWYREWAEQTGGPVLALACGTGRLVCRLAEAGLRTVGLDLSDGMLARAAEHAAELDDAARDRVRFVKGDMSDFDLGETFGLVFIADNSFRELKTREELLACLKCIRRHVRDDGVVLITERRQEPSFYADGPRVWDWAPVADHPATGEGVWRRVHVGLTPDGRFVRGSMDYKIVHADGSETVHECPFEGLLLDRRDYMALFAEAGFQTRVCVGYQRRADDGKHPILCFVCTQRVDEPPGGE